MTFINFYSDLIAKRENPVISQQPSQSAVANDTVFTKPVSMPEPSDMATTLAMGEEGGGSPFPPPEPTPIPMPGEPIITTFAMGEEGGGLPFPPPPEPPKIPGQSSIQDSVDFLDRLDENHNEQLDKTIKVPNSLKTNWQDKVLLANLYDVDLNQDIITNWRDEVIIDKTKYKMNKTGEILAGKDGKISAEELSKIDINKDGKLGQWEFKQFNKALPLVEKTLQELDSNKEARLALGHQAREANNPDEVKQLFNQERQIQNEQNELLDNYEKATGLEAPEKRTNPEAAELELLIMANDDARLVLRHQSQSVMGNPEDLRELITQDQQLIAEKAQLENSYKLTTGSEYDGPKESLVLKESKNAKDERMKSGLELAIKTNREALANIEKQLQDPQIDIETKLSLHQQKIQLEQEYYQHQETLQIINTGEIPPLMPPPPPPMPPNNPFDFIGRIVDLINKYLNR